MKVRESLPVRRKNPSKNPPKKWSEHKPDLREDFHNHCAYCGSFDGFRHTYFEVDHFIPKSFLIETNSKISLTQYSNLVYACKFCNNNKSSTWPSNSETIFDLNDEGFIDPCDAVYDDHLYRTKDGGIMWKTKLGEWMAKIAFKFDERDYSIKLLWEVSQIRKLVLAFALVLSKMDEQSQEYKIIKMKAGDLSFKYVIIHNELMDYYNSI